MVEDLTTFPPFHLICTIPLVHTFNNAKVLHPYKLIILYKHNPLNTVSTPINGHGTTIPFRVYSIMCVR